MYQWRHAPPFDVCVCVCVCVCPCRHALASSERTLAAECAACWCAMVSSGDFAPLAATLYCYMLTQQLPLHLEDGSCSTCSAAVKWYAMWLDWHHMVLMNGLQMGVWWFRRLRRGNLAHVVRKWSSISPLGWVTMAPCGASECIAGSHLVYMPFAWSKWHHMVPVNGLQEVVWCLRRLNRGSMSHFMPNENGMQPLLFCFVWLERHQTVLLMDCKR